MTDVNAPTPNEPTFWDQRYVAGKMPWDCGGVPGALAAYLRRHPRGGRALVPGCGSGYEIHAFEAAGWDVLGLDFSAAAVQRARAVLGLLADRVTEGDFFTHPLAVAGFDLVYERTLLCALPPETWAAYARRVAELLKPGAVLCGFFFLVPKTSRRPTRSPRPHSPPCLDRPLNGAPTNR